MFFVARIAVMDDSGKVAAVSVPATFETCWLCGGRGTVLPSKGHPERTQCAVCDGQGRVLTVAWHQVDPSIRQGFDRIWAGGGCA